MCDSTQLNVLKILVTLLQNYVYIFQNINKKENYVFKNHVLLLVVSQLSKFVKSSTNSILKQLE